MLRSLRRDQPGQLAATSDHDEVAGAARQQGPHLSRFARVVEQHEHPPARQHAPVQRRPRVEVGGNALRWHVQGAEQSPEGFARRRGLSRRIETTQIDEKLPIRITLGDLVAPAHRQCRLPDPGRADDDGDRNDPGRLAGLARYLSQRPELSGAPGEIADRGRQLPRD